MGTPPAPVVASGPASGTAGVPPAAGLPASAPPVAVVPPAVRERLREIGRYDKFRVFEEK